VAAPPHTRPVRSSSAERLATIQLCGILLAGFVLRVAFVQSPGYHDDMLLFYSWFRSISVLGPGQIYAHVPGLNYPPLYVVLIEVSSAALRFFVHGPPSDATLNLVFKLPPILFDLAGAALAYRIVRRSAGPSFALLSAAFMAFNPAIIYDSAYWGQNDAIPAILALLAIAALSSGNVVAAWLSIACAVLFKPPVFVLVPLLVMYPLTLASDARRLALGWSCVGAAAACALTEALAVLFFPHPTLWAALDNLARQIVTGSSYFAVNSLNAFNVWAVFEPFFVSDRTRFLFLSLHLFGDLLFCAAAALICWRYAASRGAAGLFQAAALLLLAFFLLLTEMHERYLYYAVIFLGVLLFRRAYRWAALIASLTLLFNLEYGLTFMYLDDAHATMVNRYEFAPWLVHICSFANIGVFLWLLCDYLGIGGFAAAARRLLPLEPIDDLTASKRGPA
jgi:dolichyl-phosphate-mannose-protein mannosyltransferase